MMKPNETYRKLGFWSSHPAALQKSRKVFLLLSFLPILLFICVLALVCPNFESCKRILLNPGLPFRIGAIAVCMTMGAIFCVCLMSLLSIYKTSSDDKVDKEMRPFSGWMIPIFSIAWLGPYLLSLFKNNIWNGPYVGVIEFVLNMICIVPFLVLCVLLLARSRKSKARGTVKIPLWPLIAGITALVISALPLFTDVHGGIAAMFPNSRIAQTLHKSVLRLIMFGLFFPIGTMFLCLWDVIQKSRKVDDTADKSVDDDIDVDRRDASLTLDVLNEFVASEKDLTWKEPPCQDARDNRVQGNAYAELEKQDMNYAAMFSSGGPTPGQKNFLQQLVAAYETYVADVVGDKGKEDVLRDIIIGGPQGSGRTEALCAAAILAVLSRGDKVLLFVRDNIAAQVVRKRIEGKLQGMLLQEESGQYVSVRCLCHGDFSKWVRDDHYMSVVPDILITTPVVFEKETFAVDFSAEYRLHAMDILVEYSTLLVDDTCENPSLVQAHLVFLLKKLRMLLAVNGRFSQLVMVAPNDSALSTMQTAFPFDKKGARVVLFTPRKDFDAWHATLQIGQTCSSSEVCRKLIGRCSDSGLRVVVYGASGGVVGKGISFWKSDVPMINRLDEWELREYRFAPDVVICNSPPDESTINTLRCNLMDEGSVLVFVCGKNNAGIVGKPLKRVLPNNTSRAMCYAHLRSVLPFIMPRLPVDASFWNMFGIRWHDDDMSREEPQKKFNCVDWVYDALQGNGYDLGPQIALMTNLIGVPAGKGIDYGCFPEMVDVFWQTGDNIGDRRIHVGQVDEGAGERQSRYARWKNREGDYLGRTDLSTGDSLICLHDGIRYYCNVPISGAAEDCAMTLEGVPCDGTANDHEIPVREVRWELPDGFSIDKLIEDNDRRTARFCVPENVGVCVECRLTGTMNCLGHIESFERQDIKAEYGFPVNLTGFIFSPRSDSERRPVSIGRQWATDERFGYSPILTHALTAVFRSKFEGFTFYASLLAFVTRGARDSVGDAVIWIVEPMNTGRVCSSEILVSLKRQDELIAEVLREALQLIRDVKNDGIEQLRIFSGVAYNGEEFMPNDADVACDILEQLLLSREERKKTDADNRERIEEFRKTRRDRRRLGKDGSQEEEFDKVLTEGFLQFRNEIDVSKFARSIDAGGYGWPIHRITDAYEDFLWNHPEIFFVKKNWHLSPPVLSSGEVDRLVFDNYLYELTPEQYAEALEKLREARASALKTVVDVVNPIEKARLLHDYLVKICDCNEDAKRPASIYASTAYGALVDHNAVSEGYSMAYRYLLDAVGIECEEVLGKESYWNYVKFNGHWYHVDVAADDLVRNNGAEDVVQHKYFLLSDKAMVERGHCLGFTRGLPPATDTWYDDFKWGDCGEKTESGEKKAKGKGRTSKITGADVIERYRNHVAFRAQNQGCSLYCRGHIRIRVFFIDDLTSSWDANARKDFLRLVEMSTRMLEKEARADGVVIEIEANDVEDRKVSREVLPNKGTEHWIAELFEVNLTEDQTRFRRAVDCDESPIIFAFNKKFRPCARSAKDGEPGRRSDPEWSMVAYSKDYREEWVKYAIVHELLHQFGAIDLYYPPAITIAGEKHLKNSIMNCGMEIDDLTRFLIGWRRELSGQAINFLEATKDVTEAQVREALEKEWEETA